MRSIRILEYSNIRNIIPLWRKTKQKRNDQKSESVSRRTYDVWDDPCWSKLSIGVCSHDHHICALCQWYIFPLIRKFSISLITTCHLVYSLYRYLPEPSRRHNLWEPSFFISSTSSQGEEESSHYHWYCMHYHDQVTIIIALLATIATYAQRSVEHRIHSKHKLDAAVEAASDDNKAQQSLEK